MNYYKRHIGDYAAATRHLSILEHGVYMLLLDLYYTSEAPLSNEIKEVCRKVGARTKDEVAAVNAVLKDFFTHTETGWTQSRCDVEIGLFQAKSETNRVTGRKGGRPNKETQTVSKENPEITQPVSANTNLETLTTNHKPLTTNHKLNTPPDGVSEIVWADFVQHRKDKRSRITVTAIDAIKSEAAIAGWPLEAALSECCARGWTGFKAAWVAPGKQPANSEPAWRTEQRNRTIQAVPNIAENHTPATEFFEIEAKNVTSIAMG